MRRGVSQILTSLLLTLLVLGVAALIYPWASSLVASISTIFFQDVSALKETVGAILEVYPPPAIINAPEANYPVIIHNSGLSTLTGVKVYIIPPGATAPLYITTQKIDINGNVVDPAPTLDAKDLGTGETLIAYMPEGNDYRGYTIVVTGRNLLVPYTVVVGE